MSPREATASRGLYERMPTFLGEESRFINQGFWRDGPQSQDEASRALVALLGRAARMGPGQRVLDVGCGWGEQDVIWMRDFGPRRIVGVNVTPTQVRGARRLAMEEGMGDRVTFQLASAVALPFRPRSFDRVVALECAHHFGSRFDFFREALRVLAPGGRLATTDIIPMGVVGRRGRLRPAWDPSWARNDTLMPPANVRTRQQYAEDLREAGFVDVRVVSIREHVWAPQARYLAGRIQRGELVTTGLGGIAEDGGSDSEARERAAFQKRLAWALDRLSRPESAERYLVEAERGPLDYVVAVGVRPGGAGSA